MANQDEYLKYILYTLIAVFVMHFLWSKRENFDMQPSEPALLEDLEKHTAYISVSDEEQQKRELDFLEERRKANAELSNINTLLPNDITEFSPDLTTANFLTAGEHYGIDTRPKTKVKNLDMLRPLPTIPRDVNDQPWFNMSSFSADIPNKPLY